MAWGGQAGKGVVVPPAFAKGYGKDSGKGWGKDWGKGKGFGKDGKGFGKDGKGKGKRPRGPSGPGLPRERITQEPMTGEVAEWKGKYGWITPTVPLEHPMAAKNKGNLYVSMSDLVGGIEALTKGASASSTCSATPAAWAQRNASAREGGFDGGAAWPSVCPHPHPHINGKLG
eukprot:CAMPEP_0183438124 /NCGR_PEP_ID=MMETSP0370-20130417/76242_1 /TAXON_ID=268820 /ORGANISM="Peridinium aciculiferum, Strain PAER-2" /LENGTH=172 /DNA_ID=CAMNT_0025626229 /DNA_START=64 /DNA_END=580 /DNA_ORIENTATION=-